MNTWARSRPLAATLARVSSVGTRPVFARQAGSMSDRGRFFLRRAAAIFARRSGSPAFAWVRRGFAGSVTLSATDFLGLASVLFARHPIRTVVLYDLWARYSLDWPGSVEAVVGGPGYRGDAWPAALFPELESTPARVSYRFREEAVADLSARAVAFGRRAAGLG